MIAMSGHPRDPEETAVKRVERLGYAAEDVKHVALTRLHFDHAGGLPDSPQAKVHTCGYVIRNGCD
jgi:glyoxylase-like metal-dependent hydrolase (beta-lactamase superfamily II)